MGRSVYQYEQPRCPDNWNEAERRFYNRLIETLDDIYSKYGRLDERMLSKGVLNRIDNSTATSLEKMTADILSAGKITADSIEATFAYLVSLSAKYGSFDFETVKNLVADAMVLEKGQADYVHITNLAATYAQAVNATIGNLVIQSSDGKYYQLDVSADGKVSAKETTVTDGEIAAGETSGGKVIVGTHITAETLGTATLAATQALINMIDASRINVDTLVAREEFVQTLTANEAFVDSLVANTAFIKQLGTTTIVGDKSITMLAGEVGDLDRLSNIEVIEGTFAQAERREGEGIHIYSEIGPKQAGNGEPSPENIRPIEGRASLNAWHAGVNLAPTHTDFPTNAGLTCTSSGGVLTISGTATKNARLDSPYIVLLPGTYTLKPNHTALMDVSIYMRKRDGGIFGSVSLKNSLAAKSTFTVAEPTEACVSIYMTTGTAVDSSFAVMLNRGSEALPFELYSGGQYTIKFSETVYGGSLDWNAGVLIADRVVRTLDGTEDWKASTTNTPGKSRFYAPGIAPGILPPANTSTTAKGLMCSHYKAAPSTTGGTHQCVQSVGVYTSGSVYFFDDRYAAGTAVAWKAYVAEQYAAGTPIQVAYTLAEPIALPLKEGSDSVQLISLKGLNTVYTDADAGQVEFGHNALVNDVNDLYAGQSKIEEALSMKPIFLEINGEENVVIVGQVGETSEFHIDSNGCGVVVGGDVFSRFESDRVRFGNMVVWKPGSVGGLAFDSIADMT